MCVSKPLDLNVLQEVPQTVFAKIKSSNGYKTQFDLECF